MVTVKYAGRAASLPYIFGLLGTNQRKRDLYLRYIRTRVTPKPRASRALDLDWAFVTMVLAPILYTVNTLPINENRKISFVPLYPRKLAAWELGSAVKIQIL